MARATVRPLSPHLSIWRWGPAMLVSILHRVAGDGLAVVGGIALIWWLTAAASGPESYAFFMSVATSWVGYIFMIGLTWAFIEHLLSGLRHLVLDIGAGYELKTNRVWASAIPVAAIVLTALIWLYVLVGK